mgnify:CR=1 FL=1
MANITVVSEIASKKMVEALIADPDVLLITADKSHSADFEQQQFAPSGGTIQIGVDDQPQMAANQVAFRNDPLSMRQVPLTYSNYTTGLEIGAINETLMSEDSVMSVYCCSGQRLVVHSADVDIVVGPIVADHRVNLTLWI